MNKGYTESQYSQTNKRSSINQAGLDEAEQNYNLKYGSSNFSEVNNTQRVSKRISGQILPEGTGFSKIKYSQNQVLRELKQQYEILRNLPIEENNFSQLKQKAAVPSSENSSYTNKSQQSSYLASQKNHKKTKHESQAAQILQLQKKQLQIVINNSMRKIQQLLTTQMQLKKIIHEQKLQIQGKGGINSQYQNIIKSLKRNQKQLVDNLHILKQQIQKKNKIIKQLGEKLAYYQGVKSRTDQEERNYYQEQKKMDDLLRNQKQKVMNIQLQFKKVSMEFQIYQKDKSAEINRLMRQLEDSSQAPYHENQTIRKLEDELKKKQQCFSALSQQMQHIKSQSTIQAPAQQNKNILQSLVKQIKQKSDNTAKDNNQTIFKALIDKLGQQKSQGLKNEVSSLRNEVEVFKRQSSRLQNSGAFGVDKQSKIKIRELQKTIDEQKFEIRQFQHFVEKLKQQKYQLESTIQINNYKCKQLQQHVSELQHRTINIDESHVQNRAGGINSRKLFNFQPHATIQDYQNQNNELKKIIDQLTMLKEQQTQQNSRLNADANRYKSLYNEKQSEMLRTVTRLNHQLQQKSLQVQLISKKLLDMQSTHLLTNQSSAQSYQQKFKSEQKRFMLDIQALNLKIVQLTKTNQTFTQKFQYYSSLQKEVHQLRNNSKKQKKVNQTVDHLWQIKETEYDNVNEILNAVPK